MHFFEPAVEHWGAFQVARRIRIHWMILMGVLGLLLSRVLFLIFAMGSLSNPIVEESEWSSEFSIVAEIGLRIIYYNLMCF
ncbi:MAG: hypothetical protein ACEPOZ_14215 [Marinifilaceae bacterium]